MRTTLDIDPDLLEKVVETTGERSKTRAVNRALEEYGSPCKDQRAAGDGRQDPTQRYAGAAAGGRQAQASFPGRTEEQVG